MGSHGNTNRPSLSGQRLWEAGKTAARRATGALCTPANSLYLDHDAEATWGLKSAFRAGKALTHPNVSLLPVNYP